MKFKCGGTLGDTFMNIVRLYDKNPTEINHFTKHAEQYGVIKTMYNLLGDVKVNEANNSKNYSFQGFLEPGQDYTPFPEFELPSIKRFDLPEEYIVVQLQAGVSLTKHPWRFLSKSDLEKVRKDKSIILIGTDNRTVDLYSEFSIIDLRGKTTLLESFAVIRDASEFYAPQGVLGFVALSQKVPTTLWLKHKIELRGMAVRVGMIKEWEEYITYINLIK